MGKDSLSYLEAFLARLASQNLTMKNSLTKEGTQVTDHADIPSQCNAVTGHKVQFAEVRPADAAYALVTFT